MIRTHGSTTQKCPVAGCRRRRYLGGKCTIHTVSDTVARIMEVEAAAVVGFSEADTDGNASYSGHVLEEQQR